MATSGLGSLLLWAWSKVSVAERGDARLFSDLCRISPRLLRELGLQG